MAGGRCAGGWCSATLLAVAPGSPWEGGQRLLVRLEDHSYLGQSPRQPAAQRETRQPAAQGETRNGIGPQGPLAASDGVTCHPPAPGVCTSSRQASYLECVEDAFTGPSHTPDTGQVTATDRQEGQACADTVQHPATVWVPLLWPGPCEQPFSNPVALVRHPYVLHGHEVPGTRSRNPVSSSAQGGVSDRGSSPPHPSTSAVAGSKAGAALVARELEVGSAVEAHRQGCWWPAEVLEVQHRTPAARQMDAGSKETAHTTGETAQATVLLLLRNRPPPEGDGAVWRCPAACTRPLLRDTEAEQRPDRSSQSFSPPRDNRMTASLKAQIAPQFVFTPCQAFACLEHVSLGYSRRVVSSGSDGNTPTAVGYKYMLDHSDANCRRIPGQGVAIITSTDHVLEHADARS
jgi:hypothetical protein